jgi:tetraacyldisaccharide 4'-kinase
MNGWRGSIESWLLARWYGGAAVPAWLGALEWVYARLLALRRQLYAWGVWRTRAAAVPVVVVGNLTVGGTGKTPLVAALAVALRERGWRPGILSRGYRSAQRSAVLLPAAAAPEAYGDEPVWLSRSSGVPVAIGRRRHEGALLLTQAGCDVILSDDGLQHWALARDIEILVIDGLRRFGNGRLLPAGPLREPAARAARVDLCVVNGGEARAGEIPMSVAAEWIVRVGDVADAISLGDLRGRRVHAVAGIGNPERFFTMLEAAGLVVHRHAWPDHHRFAGTEVRFDDDLLVLVTEKDAVKVARYAHERLYAVPIDVQLPAGCIDQLHARLCRLRNADGCQGV